MSHLLAILFTSMTYTNPDQLTYPIINGPNCVYDSKPTWEPWTVNGVKYAWRVTKDGQERPRKPYVVYANGEMSKSFWNCMAER